jgi:hypothetical protein
MLECAAAAAPQNSGGALLKVNYVDISFSTTYYRHTCNVA